MGRRDWSPYAAHFTKQSAMAPLQKNLKAGKPEEAIKGLPAADSVSFDALLSILAKQLIVGSAPDGYDNAWARTSFSECTLPGMVDLAEHYGRCGLLFEKTDLAALGAHPVLYLQGAHHGAVAKASKNDADLQKLQRFLHKTESKPGGPSIDYSHDREWRIPGDLDLTKAKPVAYIVPNESFYDQLRKFLVAKGLPDRPIFPLAQLHYWGA